MRNYIFIIFWCIAFVTCTTSKKPFISPYEVKNRDSANFSLSYYDLYPDEILSVYIDGKLLYKIVGQQDQKKNKERLLFQFPDEISEVRVKSEFGNTIVFDTILINTIQTHRVGLFVSPPYPKGLLELPKDPRWKPNWKKLDIDSSKRRIILEADTTTSWVCGLGK